MSELTCIQWGLSRHDNMSNGAAMNRTLKIIKPAKPNNLPFKPAKRRKNVNTCLE